MPHRLEAVIRSPIAFRHKLGEGIASYRDPPETVGIIFDGRLFVWHALNEPQHNSILGTNDRLGPTVTSVLGDDKYEDVATELECFLSALTWYYRQPAEAVAYGSQSTDDPYLPPLASGPRTHLGWMMTEPYEAMSLQRDSPALLKALGWYREGMNTGSPFYRFLAYWNSLEAVLDENEQSVLDKKRDAFLEDVVDRLRPNWEAYPLPASPAKHYRDFSRNAISHVVRYPGKPLINPDSDDDRQRIDAESRFFHEVARIGIEEKFGHPVSTG